MHENSIYIYKYVAIESQRIVYDSCDIVEDTNSCFSMMLESSVT